MTERRLRKPPPVTTTLDDRNLPAFTKVNSLLECPEINDSRRQDCLYNSNSTTDLAGKVTVKPPSDRLKPVKGWGATAFG